MTRFLRLCILAMALATPTTVVSQVRCDRIPGSIVAEVIGPASLAGARQPHAGFLLGGDAMAASSFCLDSPGPATGLDARSRLLPVRLDLDYRSAYPVDRNDGAVWAGRGVSQTFAAGAMLRRGPLRITLYPTVSYQQNQAFTIARSELPGSSFRYPYFTLDWPQRQGAGAFWTLDPGQSSIALEGGPLALSVGTENLWWGPADRYPVVLSSTAPGFPHLRVGTLRPARIGIGDLDVALVWGRLDESKYYDPDTGDDRRLLTALALGYRPAFVRGLTLGANLLRHHRWTEAGRNPSLILPFGEVGGEPTNSLASLVADWHFDESELRVYTEWARDDYWWDFEDLVTELDHAQAYALGLEKLFASPQGRWRLRTEITRLSRANPRSLRGGGGSFFVHSFIAQGHTQRGQMLGSSIGPGSNAQFFALDRARGGLLLGAYVERIRHDDDAYQDRFERTYGFRGHDIELTLGALGIQRVGQLSLEWDVSASRRKNRDFIGLDGVNWAFVRESNLVLTLSASWEPSR